jgi:uncharacterized membrane protein
MANKPMFLLAGVYEDMAPAEADYAAVQALHAAGTIGAYDSAIVCTDGDGALSVAKAEKPTPDGGWLGLAAGAAVAVVAPQAMPALVAAGGAGLGAWIAHVARGMTRRDARELAETVSGAPATLVVIGVNKDAYRVQKAASAAIRRTTKRVEGDYEEAEGEALATMVAA